jgi:curved DNA-binding protein CbpA
VSETEVEDEFVQEVMDLFEGLERLSYYEFLGVPPSCDYVAIRDAFYSRAQRYHPDRFVNRGGDSLRNAVYSIYKRMTEAYSVLSDPALRSTYDAARVRGEMRLSAVARARRLAADERRVSNPFARVYLRSAHAKLVRSDLRGALIDVELGLSLGDSEALQDLRKQILQRPGAAEVVAGSGR